MESQAAEKGQTPHRIDLTRVLLLLAIVWALVASVWRFWTCDDAYLVFRYAQNLVEGKGLVFNAGERVEGYTCFLWVLGTAPAFLLRIRPEIWTGAWGVAFYLGTIGLLGRHHVSLRNSLGRPPGLFPIAALAWAFCPDANIWATGGLETSAFAFLLVLGYVLLAEKEVTTGRAVAAGLVFGLATLTRPDGALPAAVAGLFVLWAAPARLRAGAAFGGAVISLAVPLEIFRLAYYGSLVPNTYWAKSASLAWWSQGLSYLGLWVDQYGVLLLSVPLALLAVLVGRRGGGPPPGRQVEWARPAALAASLALAWVLYVTRVGGDFMYVRLLIPASIFALVLFELALFGLSRALPGLVLAGLGLLPAVTPLLLARPVSGDFFTSGVADEWAFYAPWRQQEADENGETLRRFFHGLNVRILVFGSELRMAYRSEAPEILEAHGLTDAFVSHLPLAARGRPGHEKVAPISYAVGVRKIHFMFQRSSWRRFRMVRELPEIRIQFGSVEGLVLYWDPPVVRELVRRGAVVEDFPAALDAYLARMSGLPRTTVAADYRRFRLFYFDHVSDPAREQPFLVRLESQ